MGQFDDKIKELELEIKRLQEEKFIFMDYLFSIS